MHKYTRDLEDSLKTLERKLADIRQSLHVYDDLLSEAGEKIKFTSVRLTETGLDLTLSGSRHEFNAAWALLRKHGFTPPISRPKDGDASWSGFFYKDSVERIWLSFSSTSCRRVQVGTKMVETPIYETICEDKFGAEASHG